MVIVRAIRREVSRQEILVESTDDEFEYFARDWFGGLIYKIRLHAGGLARLDIPRSVSVRIGQKATVGQCVDWDYALFLAQFPNQRYRFPSWVEWIL